MIFLTFIHQTNNNSELTSVFIGYDQSEKAYWTFLMIENTIGAWVMLQNVK